MTTPSTNPCPHPRAPTSSLPPLIRLSTTTAVQVQAALDNLRALYFPPPPPPHPPKSSLVVVDTPLKLHKRSIQQRKLVHNDGVPDSGYASAEGEEEDEEEVIVSERGQASGTETMDNEEVTLDLDVLRSDIFERNFVIKWLTGFASRADVFLSSAPSCHPPSSASPSDLEDNEDSRATLIDDAAALLASFIHSPNASEEDGPDSSFTRSFVFPYHPSSPLSSSSTSSTIEVELNDAPPLSGDHTSVGLQSWASSIILAERICARPSTFISAPTISGLKPSLRILEIGAGTGMVSIAAAKILSHSPSKATIVATDYHPNVLGNLRRNVTMNFASSDEVPVEVHKLDWENPGLDCAPFDEPFDIILGADVVYHPSHAQWIRNCVERLLAPPTRSPPTSSGGVAQTQGGVFWMIGAIRSTGRHEGDMDTITQVFPSVGSLPVDRRNGQDHGSGRGDEELSGNKNVQYELANLEEETMARLEGGIGRVDEGGYRLFKIGWVPVWLR